MISLHSETPGDITVISSGNNIGWTQKRTICIEKLLATSCFGLQDALKDFITIGSAFNLRKRKQHQLAANWVSVNLFFHVNWSRTHGKQDKIDRRARLHRRWRLVRKRWTFGRRKRHGRIQLGIRHISSRTGVLHRHLKRDGHCNVYSQPLS